ncbi:hypothetical protein GF348_24145, partial [candidate division KSB3 bacterium]|nr:hypothetical protein [candidate division KSB3 bacterium]
MATQLDPDLARMLDEIHADWRDPPSPTEMAFTVDEAEAWPRSDMSFTVDEAEGQRAVGPVLDNAFGAPPPSERGQVRTLVSGGVPVGDLRPEADAAPVPAGPEEMRAAGAPELRDVNLGAVPDSGLSIGSTRSFSPGNYQLESPETGDLMSRYAEAARSSREPTVLPEMQVEPQDVEGRTRFSLGPSGQVVDRAEKLRKAGEATQQGLLSLAGRDKQARAAMPLAAKEGEPGYRDWAAELEAAREADARSARRIGIGAAFLGLVSPGAAQALLQATQGSRQHVDRLLAERERLTGEESTRAERALRQYQAEGVRGLQDARAGALMDERAALAADEEYMSSTVAPEVAAYAARMTGEDPETYSSMTNRDFAPILAGVQAGRTPPEDEDTAAELERLMETAGRYGTVESVNPSTGAVRFGRRRGGGGGGAPAASLPQGSLPEEGSDEARRKREWIRDIVEAGGISDPDRVDADVERLYGTYARLPFSGDSKPRGGSFEKAMQGLADSRERTGLRQQARDAGEVQRAINDNRQQLRSVRSTQLMLAGGRRGDTEIPAVPDSVVNQAIGAITVVTDESFESGSRIAVDFTLITDPRAHELAQRILTVANPVLREVSGQAVTGNEMGRFLGQLGASSLQEG